MCGEFDFVVAKVNVRGQTVTDFLDFVAGSVCNSM